MREGQKRERARELRSHMTDAERTLWRWLRMRQLQGCKFRRQVPIGPWIVDFACLQAGLVVEADGGQHCDASTDRLRDEALRRRGFVILRFWNNEILDDPQAVCEVIARWLLDRCTPA